MITNYMLRGEAWPPEEEMYVEHRLENIPETANYWSIYRHTINEKTFYTAKLVVWRDTDFQYQSNHLEDILKQILKYYFMEK